MTASIIEFHTAPEKGTSGTWLPYAQLQDKEKRINVRMVAETLKAATVMACAITRD